MIGDFIYVVFVLLSTENKVTALYIHLDRGMVLLV